MTAVATMISVQREKIYCFAPLYRCKAPTIIAAIFQEAYMGKYFLAWLLGVPFFVLVLVYLIF